MNVNNAANTSNNVILPVTIILLPTTIPVLGEQKNKMVCVFYCTQKRLHSCVGTDAPCPAGWVDQELDFMSLCYYVSNSTKEGGATRMEALFRCRRLANRQEAHLVAINSQAEMVGLHQSAQGFVLSLFSWWFFFLRLLLLFLHNFLSPLPALCVLVYLFSYLDGLTDSLQV